MKKVRLDLTSKEADMIGDLIGFVKAGEISGGPLEGDNAAQTRGRLGVLARLEVKLWHAVAMATPEQRRRTR